MSAAYCRQKPGAVRTTEASARVPARAGFVLSQVLDVVVALDNVMECFGRRCQLVQKRVEESHRRLTEAGQPLVEQSNQAGPKWRDRAGAAGDTWLAADEYHLVPGARIRVSRHVRHAATQFTLGRLGDFSTGLVR